MARRAAAPRPPAPGTASVPAPLQLLLRLTLLLFLAAAPAGAAAPSTVMDLWKWWPEGGKSAPVGAKPAYTCLADAFSSAPRDRKVHSQFGEDGIIEAIFDCIGTKDKYYVEFGTETCSECTTAYLRTKGWSGLLMDGSHENPAINLHKEYMTSENIAGLFEKHSVPHPTFDHLTVDIDLNTFWVLRAILAGGYRPRSVTAEINRSFAPTQAYAAPDMPNEYVGGPGLAAAAGGGTCFYGASALAYERLLRAYNYSLVALDGAGVNSFFVHNDEFGMPLDPAVHSVAHLTPGQPEAGVHSLWAPINADCTPALWVHIGDSPGLADVHFARHMRPELLKHTPSGRGGRSFEVVKTPGVLTMHMRRHPKHDTP